MTVGFPIRRSQDQRSFDSSPGLIAAYHVLHRLITPRHPPCTLSSLITFITIRPPVPQSNRYRFHNRDKCFATRRWSPLYHCSRIKPAALTSGILGEPRSHCLYAIVKQHVIIPSLAPILSTGTAPHITYTSSSTSRFIYIILRTGVQVIF